MQPRNRTGTGKLVMLALAWAAYGCAQTATPSAPTPITSPSVSDLLTIQICHRTESGQFHRVEIAEATTAVHLGHGDAFPGYFVPSDANFRFDTTCAMQAVQSATITFAGLTASGAPFTALDENGFIVKAASGNWTQYTNFGKPAPMAILRREQTDPEQVGTLEIRSTSGLFAFTSVDLYSSVTTIPHTISGTIDGKSVLLMVGTVPNTFGKFATVTNPNPPQMLDVLFLTVVNPATSCCGNPAGPDNIVLKR